MSTPDGTGELLAALRQVADDAEELLRTSADDVSKGAVEVRARMARSLTGARQRLRQAESRVADRARIAALQTDRYVHRNPWTVIGVASAVAFLLGTLLARRGPQRGSE